MNSKDQQQFIVALTQAAAEANSMAMEKGFWDYPVAYDRDLILPQKIALIHAELSELLEAIRAGNEPSEHIPGFFADEEEAADVAIRLFDLCEGAGWRLAEAIMAKMAFNSTRPAKHGKKF